jgi:Na+-transporting NADH:ubiquinone oxidoreductase subunit A
VNKIRKGLNVPIAGAPRQAIEAGPPITRVALLGDDYVGMRPKLQVEVGDAVKLGQVLFSDKKTPGVQYTSPGCGEVVAIKRGVRRKFESIVIRLEGDDEESFPSFEDGRLGSLDCDTARDNLVAAGLWTALRTRPFSKVPDPRSAPHAIFVTAIDTQPLAPDPRVVLAGQEKDFERGLRVLSCLTEGKLYVCVGGGTKLSGTGLERVEIAEFVGPHPAGLAGTHIHVLDRVGKKKTVWTIGYQDVLAVGRLFLTGRLPVQRVISLAGPRVSQPRLVATRLGASTDDLLEGQLAPGEARIISGSVLSGRTAADVHAYLGRYHLQVSVISDDRRRTFLGWLGLGWNKFSIKPVYTSALSGRRRKFPLTTSSQGDPRAIVPIGMYEKVLPLDLLPTALLKSIVVGDTERAQALGCLELDEEDLALCSFVCPGKHDFGSSLRDVLTRIEKEG